MSSVVLLAAGWVLVAFGGAGLRRLGLPPAERVRVMVICTGVGFAAIVTGLVVVAAPTILHAVGATEAASACRHALGLRGLGGAALGWSAILVLALVAGRATAVITRARRSVREAGVEPWLGRHENRGDFDLVVLPTDRLLAMTVPRRRAQIVISQGLVDCLEPDEVEAVIRHEDAHRRHHHPRHMLMALLVERALAPLPGTGRSAAALRSALEVWADEEAAGPRRGSRSVVGGAIVALSRPRSGRTGPTNDAEIAERLRVLSGVTRAPSLLARCSLAAPALATAALLGVLVADRLSGPHHGSVLGLFC